MTFSLTLTDQELHDALRDAFLAGIEVVDGRALAPDYEAAKYARVAITDSITNRISDLSPPY